MVPSKSFMRKRKERKMKEKKRENNGFEKITRRKFLKGVGATLTLAGVTPRSVVFGAQKKGGGTLTYATMSEIPHLDPHIHTGTAQRTIRGQILNGLFTFDENGNPIPELVESYGNPDPTTYAFKLRKDVKFHDGVGFTSEDVKYNLERILDPEIGAAYHADFKAVIDTIKIVDKHTIEVRLNKPFAPFITELAMPATQMVPKHWMLEKERNLNMELIGTGPFKLEHREPSIETVVVKNENYFKPDLPYLDKIHFQRIQNGDARTAALRSGTVDMISYVGGKDMGFFEKNSNFTLAVGPGAYQLLWFNTTKPPFNDPRVRHAVSYAFNRQVLIQTGFFGYASPMLGVPIPKGSYWYDKGLGNYFKHDLEKAKELLAEAGHPNGFEFELPTYMGFAAHRNTGIIAEASLKEIGIKAKIIPKEWVGIVNARKSGDYQALVYGRSQNIPDPHAFSLAYRTGGSYYARPTGFSDKQVDQLLTKGAANIDMQKRREIYMDLQKRLLDLSPATWCIWRIGGNAMKSKVKGYKQLSGALVLASAGIMLEKTWIE
jgi:ABC-type transport system substrate-binding protein